MNQLTIDNVLAACAIWLMPLEAMANQRSGIVTRLTNQIVNEDLKNRVLAGYNEAYHLNHTLEDEVFVQYLGLGLNLNDGLTNDQVFGALRQLVLENPATLESVKLAWKEADRLENYVMSVIEEA